MFVHRHVLKKCHVDPCVRPAIGGAPLVAALCVVVSVWSMVGCQTSTPDVNNGQDEQAVVEAARSQDVAGDPDADGKRSEVLLREGWLLDDAGVAALQDAMAANPDDWELRCKWLGVCQKNGSADPVWAKERLETVLWLVDHQPTLSVLGRDVAVFRPFMQQAAYDAVTDAWNIQLLRHPSNPSVHAHAGIAVMGGDPVLGLSRLQRAVAMAPGHAWWHSQLGFAYELQPGWPTPELAQAAYDQHALAYAGLENQQEKRFVLASMVRTAWQARLLDQATEHAEAWLVQSADPSDWNHGNAVHDANVVLGLVALKQGDQAEAVAHLAAAGKTPGSMELETFGPDFELANALLAVGERDAVVSYLKDCQAFWAMDNDRLDRWIKAIEAGNMPTLRR